MNEFVPLIADQIPRLRRYARALLRDHDRADDLVQDTILRSFEKVHLYQSGTNLRAWLFTIMHNQYVNLIRRSTRLGRQVDLEAAQLVSAPSQTITQELRDLERAIDCLPEEQRTVLLLVALEGMKYEEVAQICAVPAGTIRSRLSRARETLRHMLDGETPREKHPSCSKRATACTRGTKGGRRRRPIGEACMRRASAAKQQDQQHNAGAEFAPIAGTLSA